VRRLGALLLIIILIFVVGVLYYTNLGKNYYMLDDFYGFPVPKNAELESENEKGKHYYWKPASGDKGIPLSYKLMIRKSGWEEVERMGETGTFVKGKNTIYLQSSTDYIGIMK
jgi:hypothetical protein